MRFDLSDEEWAVIEPLAQNSENSLLFIDASIVKAHRAATGAKEGNWRRVSTARQVIAFNHREGAAAARSTRL